MSGLGIDRLRGLAEQLLAGSGEVSEFESELARKTDSVGLRDLGYEFTPHPEISVPIFRKLIELSPEDPELAAEFGFVLWLCGDAELAHDQARRGHRLNPDHVQTFLLKAALEPEADKKRHFYSMALERDPGNRIALANLDELEGT